MEMNKNSVSFAKTVALLVALGIVTSTIWYINFNTDKLFVGAKVVELMYDYSSPEELAKNQEILRTILMEEDYERLAITDTQRRANTYFEFGWAPVQVNIISSGQNCVIYTLSNENIDETQYRVLLYDTAGDKVDIIQEYKLVNTRTGGN